MADPRFFHNAGPFPLSAILSLTGAKLAEGVTGSERLFYDVAPLDRATARDVSFLDNPKYIETFSQSAPGACFVRPKLAALAPPETLLLLTNEPYYCFALTAQKFYPVQPYAPEISSRAFIHPSAAIGKNVRIEDGAVIAENVTIGDGCFIKANAVVHESVTIGNECVVGSCSTLSHCLIGDRVIIHRGVNIGQDGFGYAQSREGHVKVPQLGRVIIENDVEIGSGTCIDRGAGPDTVIGEGTKIDNLVQIGHNAVIGKKVIIVSQVGVAGSTRIGDGAMLGGQSGITGHIRIGAGARLAAGTGAITDVPAGATWGGYPAQPIKDWHRQTITLSKLIRKRDEDSDDD